jgi:branched-chain amino acid aminotransferase
VEILLDFEYFSHNGQLLPAAQAVIPLTGIEYSYGFGVYETIRVQADVPYFLSDHMNRLMESAQLIGLEHSFSADFIARSVSELAQQTRAGTYNLKVLLIGGQSRDEANFYILCLKPFFPDRKLYAAGAKLITYRYERAFPHAKSLDMLQSYLAYREARTAGAYDALFVNREGYITEGSRTNFLGLQGKTIISPPEAGILLGVMRKVVLKVAAANGYAVKEAPVTFQDVCQYDGAFITSTSSKLMPVGSIDDHSYGPLPASLKTLMDLTDAFLLASRGQA